jgi:SAM-dependent methyltransferase
MKEVSRNVLGYGGRVPVVRKLLVVLLDYKLRKHPWLRPHPFDLAYGTQTRGLVPSWLLRSGDSADAHAGAYGACQPSCLRRAIETIPHPEDRAFVDLGCGKGRGLIVASEWPFKRVVGLELSPALADDARRNAGVIRASYPDRTQIKVVQGDATTVAWPVGDLVVFLNNSFDQELVARMLHRMMECVAAEKSEIFLIYENPVHFHLVDENSAFKRWHCETVRCADSEVGFAPDDDETFVTWRLGSAPFVAAPDAQLPIMLTGSRAKIAAAPRQQ